MPEFFASDRNGAVPIVPVSAAALPGWLERHPQSRDWIAGVGFKAEPGTFAFLPHANGRPASVVAAPGEGSPVYAFANLPMALPEGKYALELGSEHSATDAALGWALGSYAFTP